MSEEGRWLLFIFLGLKVFSKLLLCSLILQVLLRSDNSKVWGSPCFAQVTPCLAKQPLKLLAPHGARALSGVHSVDGRELLAGTGTSKMEVGGGGYTWGDLNATWRPWKSLCKPQVFMLGESRHWSVLCSWLWGQAWLQGPGWELPTILLCF